MLTPDDRALMGDLEAVWTALNRFFEPFTDVEWVRPHGADWMYADIPYHLAVYNRMAANVILIGEEGDMDDSPSIISLAQLDRWNQASLRAMRMIGGTSDGLEKMRDSQAMLRAAVSSVDTLDLPVWLMTLHARGWRTARLAVEYAQWHNWLHLAEAALRFHNRLPLLAPNALRRALDFDMHYLASMVTAERARALVGADPVMWSVEIVLPESGSAGWTFTIDPTAPPDGETPACTASSKFRDNADILVSTDLTTYLKTLHFNMMNTTIALWTGKIKQKGAGGIGKMQALFSPTPDQVWTPIRRERVQHAAR